MNMKKVQIVIVDFGSQYTTLIARLLAQLGYQSLTFAPEAVSDYLKYHKPRAFILSGGNASVYDKDAPTIDPQVLSGAYKVLGICYGMQLIAHMKDKSSVIRGNVKQKGYGPVNIISLDSDFLFKGINESITVWASHGDVVASVPEGFFATTYSNDNVLESFQNDEGTIFGVQFHPEVIQTNDNDLILKNFIEISLCEKDWNATDVVKTIQEETIAQIGNGKALIGVSGGVDSTTIGAILAKKLGDQLHAFIINHGGMRKNEIKEVCIIAQKAGIDLHVIDASAYFFETIGDAIDAEEKRKSFQFAYVAMIERVIREQNITHLIQGTLATDLIESGKMGKSALIKSHHNVGLTFSVPQIEPFNKLFKYEVRAISRLVGLDKEISERKPFPGPGLYLRVLGVPATPENIEIVRFADDVVTRILKEENCYDGISQLVVALDGTKTVGIKGDARSLAYSIIVRPVQTTDFMTVSPYYLPNEVVEKIINEVTKHDSINRVFFDYTPKPPATTEFQ